MKKSLVIVIVITLAIVLGIFYYLLKESPKTEFCIKEGEIYQSPTVLGEIRGECCDNMVAIAEYTLLEINCELFQQEAGGNLICADCGNNVCDKDWENECNCPEDCK